MPQSEAHQVTETPETARNVRFVRVVGSRFCSRETRCTNSALPSTASVLNLSGTCPSIVTSVAKVTEVIRWFATGKKASNSRDAISERDKGWSDAKLVSLRRMKPPETCATPCWTQLKCASSLYHLLPNLSCKDMQTHTKYKKKNGTGWTSSPGVSLKLIRTSLHHSSSTKA